MKFREFYLIIRQNIKFIAVFSITVIILVEAASWYASGGYEVSLALSVFSKTTPVTPPSAQSVQDYQFDGYWSVKAADAFADTVSQWFKNPEVVSLIFAKAGVSAKSRLVSSAISAQKMAPQYVEVEFGVVNSVDAGRIAKAAGDVLQGKAEMASKYSGAVFTIVAGEPVVAKNQASFIFNGLIALIGGFLITIFIVLLKENDNWN